MRRRGPVNGYTSGTLEFSTTSGVICVNIPAELCRTVENTIETRKRRKLTKVSAPIIAEYKV